MRNPESTCELARFLTLHVALGVAVGVAVASVAVFSICWGSRTYSSQAVTPTCRLQSCSWTAPQYSLPQKPSAR